MKKDDLTKMLSETSKMIEGSDFTHHRITQLWVQINCLKQTVEDMIKLRTKTSDNEQQTNI